MSTERSLATGRAVLLLARAQFTADNANRRKVVGTRTTRLKHQPRPLLLRKLCLTRCSLLSRVCLSARLDAGAAYGAGSAGDGFPH